MNKWNDPEPDAEFLEWLRSFLGPPPKAKRERSWPDEKLMVLYRDLYEAFTAGRNLMRDNNESTTSTK